MTDREVETPESKPLSGVTVVDFTHVLAGPACAYFLGLLGADVIKVESYARGDSMRHRGGTDPHRAADAMSTAYMTQAAGKRSIALDLGAAAGREILERLLAGADVLVENHRPETMTSLGLDRNIILGKNPRLIYCAMSGYGRGGQLENAPAYDVNIQAASGIMTMTGTAEAGPTRTGAPIMDYGSALAAGFAISTALYQRGETGRGTFIDVSMLETAYTLMSSTITDYLATDNAPKQRGNQANSRSPGAGNFDCREGMISLGVNEESQFKALAHVLGCDHWLTDPRFADRPQRKVNEAVLTEELAQRLLDKTAEEWEREMMAGGVPAAKVRTLPESLALSGANGRQFLHEDAESGMTFPTLPFRIADAAIHAPTCTPPTLGMNTREILAELGYSEAQITELGRTRTIRTTAEG